MRTVAVIQARMGSQRLPGKSLETIGDRPLLAWTMTSVLAVADLTELVVATTEDPADDPLVALIENAGVRVHRGPVHDVLARCWAAVEGFAPDVVLRQTGDNPFCDPRVAAAQVHALVERGLDYVGIAGWPLGIAAEVCTASALAAAARESIDPAEREHVLPFVYRRPERFRLGNLNPSPPLRAGAASLRFTVDTAEDLAFARSIAGYLRHGPPVLLDELQQILARHPELAMINAHVEQKTWSIVDERARADRD
jgi:spore coat polysaccharide biosynthesis protein SpsF